LALQVNTQPPLVGDTNGNDDDDHHAKLMNTEEATATDA
jgi:hypothetical protein